MRTKSPFITTCLLSALTVSFSDIAVPARTQASGQRKLVVKVKAQDGTAIDLYGESHALVIGVSKYDGGLRDLPGVERDLPEVKTALEKHGFQVKVLLNPTRKIIDEEINSFIDDFGQSPENRLLIYFAGHGSTMKLADGREMGYIVPADVPASLAAGVSLRRFAISMDTIEGYARRIESKHALFVFDSCFSGSLFQALRPDALVPPVISGKTALPVRQFITAGTAEQSVPDKSIFREVFVGGLNGAADLNSDGYVTVTELAMYVEDKVGNYSRGTQTPRYGKIRDPKLDQGDMVFVLPKNADKNVNDAALISSKQPQHSGGAGFDPVTQPAIHITKVPAYYPPGGSSETDQITGTVSGIEDPARYRVVIYARTNHWWVQPLADAPFTKINSEGSWSTESHLGSTYAALLVKPSFTPPPETETLPPLGGEVVASTIVAGRRK